MSTRSKVSMVVCLVAVFAVATQLIGVIATLAIALLVLGGFIHSVGWKRAMFPFVAHFGGNE